MPRQLVLDLPVRPALGRGDFFVSPANRLALAQVESDASWPQGKLVLAGPGGSGKTHLVHVWAHDTGARIVDAAGIAGADLADLARAPRIAVEDADRIAGDRAAETALFHLHNLIAAAGGRLLVTARSAPLHWRLGLPDLESRLGAAAVARIDAPDDALLAAILVKLFADRQLAVPPALVPWLVRRMERSTAAARDLVGAIDSRALAEARPITRGLVAEVLDSRAQRGQ